LRSVRVGAQVLMMHDLRNALGYEDAITKARENCALFDQPAFAEWLTKQEDAIQEMSKCCPPDKVYRVPVVLKSACVVLGYGPETVRVMFMDGKEASLPPDELVELKV